MQRRPSLQCPRRWAAARAFVLPVAVLLAITLPHLDQGDFRGDTGWYAAIALQAWRTGELWTLWADPGQPYFNKPPLAFWIHGLFLHILGPSVWAARLPTVLAAAMCIAATVGAARELAGRRAALLSGIILALTMDFFRRGREISLDVWQTLFLLLGVWCVARAVSSGRGRWVLLSGVPVGAALLTKPLMALLFFPIIGAWLVWSARGRFVGPRTGAAVIALAVALPWHISMWRIHGHEFTAQYLGAEIASRAAGELQAGHTRRPPVWYYAEFLVEGYWPWLIVVVLAAATLIRGRPLARDARLPALALLWGGAWIALLTIFPDRRDRYAVVFLPALAWLAGMWLSYAPYPGKSGVLRIANRFLGPVVVAAGIAIAILPVRIQSGPDRHWQDLYAWVRTNTPPDQRPRVWQGGLEAFMGARMYLEFGQWAQPTSDHRGRRIASPPEGAAILYHYRGGLIPGDNERLVFASDNGQLRVTRLEAGEWRPSRVGDPGE
jgi:4-amino-4-deoxy-L-arabinose transferase-like glycosyltransferase